MTAEDSRPEVETLGAQDMLSAGPTGAHRKYVEDNEADWLSDDEQTEVYKAIIRTVSRSQGHAISGPTIYEVFGAIFEDREREAWDWGYTAGHSNAMRRMSDEPKAPTTPNPYRADRKAGGGK